MNIDEMVKKVAMEMAIGDLMKTEETEKVVNDVALICIRQLLQKDADANNDTVIFQLKIMSKLFEKIAATIDEYSVLMEEELEKSE